MSFLVGYVLISLKNDLEENHSSFSIFILNGGKVTSMQPEMHFYQVPMADLTNSVWLFLTLKIQILLLLDLI